MEEGDEHKACCMKFSKELKNFLKDIIHRGENKGDNKFLLRNNVKRNKPVSLEFYTWRHGFSMLSVGLKNASDKIVFFLGDCGCASGRDWPLNQQTEREGPPSPMWAPSATVLVAHVNR